MEKGQSLQEEMLRRLDNYILNNENGRKILANSEFAAIFRQSSLDIEAICSIFDISPKQREYIEDSPAGQGVLVFGDDKAIIENKAYNLPSGVKVMTPKAYSVHTKNQSFMQRLTFQNERPSLY